MVAMRQGLIVSVSFASEAFVGDIFYDLAKAAMCRLALGMAHELKPYGVASLALSPGFVRTERVADAGMGSQATETPLYAGRAVAALAGDADILRWSGRALHVRGRRRRSTASPTRMAPGRAASSCRNQPGSRTRRHKAAEGRTMSLKGKTLFITGASRGIGLAIALRAARDGANIAIAAKTAEPHPKLPGTDLLRRRRDRGGRRQGAAARRRRARRGGGARGASTRPSAPSAASTSSSTTPAPSS